MTQPPSPPATADALMARLRAATPARVALGRAGPALPTAAVLAFGIDHARARDAVHAALDVDALRASLAEAGLAALALRSAAADRATYLRRPDLGRRLDDASRAVVQSAPACDLALVVADGLSALAAQRHAAAVIRVLLPLLPPMVGSVGAVVAEQARVALGDEIGAALRSRMVMVLIGERPGLSAPDSLGLYLTWSPRVGRSDAERNCISNIRADGLSGAAAAHKAAWLIGQAWRLGLTGVALLDHGGQPALDGTAPGVPGLPHASG